jgi:hypothetical protein
VSFHDSLDGCYAGGGLKCAVGLKGASGRIDQFD